MAELKTKVYKVTLQSGGRPFIQYFTEAALPLVSQELFSQTKDGQSTTAILSTFLTDLTAVNLTDFMGAGGVICGPVELK